MMPSIIPHLLALLMVLVAGGAYAQNIEEQRQKIEQFRQQVSSLQASNAAIEKQLQQLEQDISDQAESYAPEAKALKEAEFNYQQALRTSERVPSASNKERAENTRFTFLMAERKYQRSAEGVTELAKQQTLLREQLADNQQRINSTKVQLGEQQELILRLEKQAREHATALAKKKERELRMKKESALRANREALDRARNERAAAMAELAELKAKLAAQKRAKRHTISTLPITAAGVTVASSRPTSSPIRSQPAPLAARLPMDEKETEGLPSLLGDKAQYMALLETARQQGSRARSSKIMHMNTLADDRIIRKTAHSLKHRGNGVYEGRTPVRAGMTTLVVGSKQWRWEIPGNDNNTMYRFVLDTRDNSNTELKIFRAKDVK